MIRLFSTEEAVKIATLAEGVAVAHGWHVALTGGSLYRTGLRKDVDLVFYGLRDNEIAPAREPLLEALALVGIVAGRSYGWVVKAELVGGGCVDLLFPEFPRGEQDKCYPAPGISEIAA